MTETGMCDRFRILNFGHWILPFDLSQGGEPVENPELVNNPEPGRRVEVVEPFGI